MVYLRIVNPDPVVIIINQQLMFKDKNNIFKTLTLITHKILIDRCLFLVICTEKCGWAKTKVYIFTHRNCELICMALLKQSLLIISHYQIFSKKLLMNQILFQKLLVN
jgi:hypothetical protein